MLEIKEISKVESRCGICCSQCDFKKSGTCQGCLEMMKPFWGDMCPIKTCAQDKKFNCCGECKEFPCALLKSFAYDEKQGDNGLRIENCEKWCKK